MKVVAPNADVDFAFTGAFGGPADADVTGEATVMVGTPVPNVENVLPMWLPSTCVYGPLAGDIAANPPPDGSPSYTLNSPRYDRQRLDGDQHDHADHGGLRHAEREPDDHDRATSRRGRPA